MARRRLLGLLAVATALVAREAKAQQLTDLPPPTGSPAVTSGVEQTRPYWVRSGEHRPFLAAQLELGMVYYRPTLQAGWGKPHYEWFGAEGGTAVSISGTTLYGGLRGQLPNIGLRIGARYEAPFAQRLLPRQHQYDRLDLETVKTPHSRYLSWEAEVTANWPVPGGSMLMVLSGYHIDAQIEGYNIWEQNLRQVVEPPWLYRARLGYLAHVGWLGSMRVGAAAEIIGIPLRDTAAVRAGPIITVSLTHHLQAVGAIMLVARERDTFGIRGADMGQLGLVYRWATGDRFAEFP
ncbi:MAG: hypothetical protein KC731_40015 [Myxococcales bacterium]|nr:hypothetical protein [Myxococcales bacterium]